MGTKLAIQDQAGKRVLVRGLDDGAPLGFGVLLEEGNILLCDGRKIHSNHCRWIVAYGAVPNFYITLQKDAVAYDSPDERSLIKIEDRAVPKDLNFVIKDMACRLLNGTPVIAGRFTSVHKELWLVLSELSLPRVPMQLQVIRN